MASPPSAASLTAREAAVFLLHHVACSMEQTSTDIAVSVMTEQVCVEIAHAGHEHFAEQICQLIEQSAQQRGTGIARRNPEYIRTKMREGKAIIAHCMGELVGFCYIETWEHGRYVANSGLIVAPQWRNHGIARRIKYAAFALSRRLYPNAKIFSITTSAAVMKLNSELGFRPVHFSQLTSDDEFWRGCASCRNYDILQRTNRTMCLCTGLLYDPAEHPDHSLPVIDPTPNGAQQ